DFILLHIVSYGDGLIWGRTLQHLVFRQVFLLEMADEVQKDRWHYQEPDMVRRRKPGAVGKLPFGPEEHS
ncbi:hypothetical protein HAX54_005513, partial [Datura stramonium]|nr:hypothetical protein [Datura stramonium]